MGSFLVAYPYIYISVTGAQADSVARAHTHSDSHDIDSQTDILDDMRLTIITMFIFLLLSMSGYVDVSLSTLTMAHTVTTSTYRNNSLHFIFKTKRRTAQGVQRHYALLDKWCSSEMVSN